MDFKIKDRTDLFQTRCEPHHWIKLEGVGGGTQQALSKTRPGRVDLRDLSSQGGQNQVEELNRKVDQLMAEIRSTKSDRGNPRSYTVSI